MTTHKGGINYRHHSGGVKDVDTEKRIVTGYASTFNNVDLTGDIVTPKAFNRTLKTRGTRIKVLWQHDAFTPIGKPSKINTDDHGLYTESTISDTAFGNDVLKLVSDGVVTDFSIGYDILDFAFDEERHMLLKELKLWEYSLVTFPANEQANVTGLKGEGPDRIVEQMQRLERSLSTGEWQSDEFAESLTLQLKQWQADLKDLRVDAPLLKAPPAPAVEQPDQLALAGHLLREVRTDIQTTLLAQALR